MLGMLENPSQIGIMSARIAIEKPINNCRHTITSEDGQSTTVYGDSRCNCYAYMTKVDGEIGMYLTRNHLPCRSAVTLFTCMQSPSITIRPVTARCKAPQSRMLDQQKVGGRRKCEISYQSIFKNRTIFLSTLKAGYVSEERMV